MIGVVPEECAREPWGGRVHVCLEELGRLLRQRGGVRDNSWNIEDSSRSGVCRVGLGGSMSGGRNSIWGGSFKSSEGLGNIKFFSLKEHEGRGMRCSWLGCWRPGHKWWPLCHETVRSDHLQVWGSINCIWGWCLRKQNILGIRGRVCAVHLLDNVGLTAVPDRMVLLNNFRVWFLRKWSPYHRLLALNFL